MTPLNRNLLVTNDLHKVYLWKHFISYLQKWLFNLLDLLHFISLKVMDKKSEMRQDLGAIRDSRVCGSFRKQHKLYPETKTEFAARVHKRFNGI